MSDTTTKEVGSDQTKPKGGNVFFNAAFALLCIAILAGAVKGCIGEKEVKPVPQASPTPTEEPEETEEASNLTVGPEQMMARAIDERDSYVNASWEEINGQLDKSVCSIAQDIKRESMQQADELGVPYEEALRTKLMMTARRMDEYTRQKTDLTGSARQTVISPSDYKQSLRYYTRKVKAASPSLKPKDVQTIADMMARQAATRSNREAARDTLLDTMAILLNLRILWASEESANQVEQPCAVSLAGLMEYLMQMDNKAELVNQINPNDKRIKRRRQYQKDGTISPPSAEATPGSALSPIPAPRQNLFLKPVTPAPAPSWSPGGKDDNSIPAQMP